MTINPLNAKHDYNRVYSILPTDSVTVIANRMCVSASIFAMLWSQIKQI